MRLIILVVLAAATFALAASPAQARFLRPTPRPLPHEATKLVSFVQRLERIRRHEQRVIHRLRRRLHQIDLQTIAPAEAVVPPPAPVPSSGFPATCVANAEESGQNSVAGYFGMISPPSAYPEPGPTLALTYGESWLNWPYSAQLQVAEAEYATYGGSAWGPRTRALCGI